MKVNKVLFIFICIFAVIGVCICIPAILPILVVIGAIALLCSPIIVLVQTGKIHKLKIQISKEDKKD